MLRKGARKALKMRRQAESKVNSSICGKGIKAGKVERRARERWVKEESESFAESVDGTSGNGM